MMRLRANDGFYSMDTKFIFLQTAAGKFYLDMLKCTSIVNRIFCNLHGGEYRQYIGVKRGKFDWQATYNRVAMLAELVNEGFRGWVIYADADAFVSDLGFDISTYLESVGPDVSLVIARGADAGKWDVNAGVFLLNLADDAGVRLVRSWEGLLGTHVPQRILDEVVEPWGCLPSGDVVMNDQMLLHLVLQNDIEILNRTKIERDLLNYSNGTFIRQVIRASSVTKDQRLGELRQGCVASLRSGNLLSFPNLDYLADKYSTDKGSQGGTGHHYTRFYSFLFEQFRFQEFSALEIGLLRGGPEAGGSLDRHPSHTPSISTWLDYFPFAKLYGMDINDFGHFQTSRFRFFKLDLSDLDAALKLRNSLPELRFCLDDASHASYHQQVAFAAFFPKVVSGGYYIIEDCQWQPRHFEGELPKVRLTRDIFDDFLVSRELDFHSSITAIVPFSPLIDQISDVFIHRVPSDGATAGVGKLIVVRKR